MDFPIRFKIAGAKHGDRLKNYKYAHLGTWFVLEREPENKFDPNAIAVYVPVKSGTHKLMLGYVPAEIAANLAPLLDEGCKFDVRFQYKIVSDDGITYGMGISINEKEGLQNDRRTKNIFDTA